MARKVVARTAARRTCRARLCWPGVSTSGLAKWIKLECGSLTTNTTVPGSFLDDWSCRFEPTPATPPKVWHPVLPAVCENGKGILRGTHSPLESEAKASLLLVRKRGQAGAPQPSLLLLLE